MDNKEIMVALRDGLTAISAMIDRMIEQQEKADTVTWVTCKQASLQCGVNVRTIQHWAYSGRFRTQRTGKIYYVCLEDVLRKVEEKRA